EHSEDCRIILLDRGSDPETEQILHEFAEYLGDGAILLRSERARGFVETINLGLERASAPLMIAVRTSTLVTPGWMEPLREAAQKPDAGVLVPVFQPREGAFSTRVKGEPPPAETGCGSFAAIGITRPLYERAGGFDCGMDGDSWCLRDYSRRAHGAGFRTLSVAGPPVLFREEPAYGSSERRERLRVESEAIFRARWGEDHAYCLRLPRNIHPEKLSLSFHTMLAGARKGHHFFVLSPGTVFRRILNAGFHRLHGNITVERIPALFPSRAVRSACARFRETYPGGVLLSGMEAVLDVCVGKGVTFHEVESAFTAAEV
ncbi:MAG: glycosyltransferase, partial [Geobacteraceae bacterium]|nr:glycosyltransferase [Geobacteraceae bacterium]